MFSQAMSDYLAPRRGRRSCGGPNVCKLCERWNEKVSKQIFVNGLSSWDHVFEKFINCNLSGSLATMPMPCREPLDSGMSWCWLRF